MAAITGTSSCSSSTIMWCQSRNHSIPIASASSSFTSTPVLNDGPSPASTTARTVGSALIDATAGAEVGHHRRVERVVPFQPRHAQPADRPVPLDADRHPATTLVA